VNFAYEYGIIWEMHKLCRGIAKANDWILVWLSITKEEAK
jgi:hypothetical protein